MWNDLIFDHPIFGNRSVFDEFGSPSTYRLPSIYPNNRPSNYGMRGVRRPNSSFEMLFNEIENSMINDITNMTIPALQEIKRINSLPFNRTISLKPSNRTNHHQHRSNRPKNNISQIREIEISKNKEVNIKNQRNENQNMMTMMKKMMNEKMEEDEQSITIKYNVAPEMKADDLVIEFQNNVLSIKAEKKTAFFPQNSDEYDAGNQNKPSQSSSSENMRSSTSFSFQRSIKLPAYVNEDDITAKLNNEILEIKIIKKNSISNNAPKIIQINDRSSSSSAASSSNLQSSESRSSDDERYELGNEGSDCLQIEVKNEKPETSDAFDVCADLAQNHENQVIDAVFFNHDVGRECEITNDGNCDEIVIHHNNDNNEVHENDDHQSENIIEIHSQNEITE